MEPLYGPNASTAAFRTSKSSPSTASPSVESLKVGSSQVWTHLVVRGRGVNRDTRTTGVLDVAKAGFTVTGAVWDALEIVVGCTDAVDLRTGVFRVAALAGMLLLFFAGLTGGVVVAKELLTVNMDKRNKSE